MLAENEEWMAGNHDKINIRGADENSYGDAVPASDGSGEPGLSMSGWFGFFAPKGTPKDIIAKLNGAMVEALADPAVRKRFADLGRRRKDSPHSKRLRSKSGGRSSRPLGLGRRRCERVHIGTPRRLPHAPLWALAV